LALSVWLDGREFASNAATLKPFDRSTRCNPKSSQSATTNPALFSWYADSLASIAQQTTDYRQLLGNPHVEAVFCAVPHHLHEEIYCAILQAGKHLMGEKPFGIDRQANARILQAVQENPDCFVRCTSELPFIPAVQRICDRLQAGQLAATLRQTRIPALERSRSEQTDQLEASHRDERRIRLYGRSRHACLSCTVSRWLADHQCARCAFQYCQRKAG
jgi:hypothetical protein